jgi:hypothetical protein
MAEPTSAPSTAAPAPEASTSQSGDAQADKKEPVVIICIGMAGSVSFSTLLMSSSQGIHILTCLVVISIIGENDVDATPQLILAQPEQASIHSQP